MRWFYAPEYDYGKGIPFVPRAIHGFVRDKPTQIRDALIAMGALSEGELEAPGDPSELPLDLVHSAEVIEGLSSSRAIARSSEFAPLAYMPTFMARRAIVRPQLLAASGTCAALAWACEGGWAVNLSGGFHHARPDLSHGFCLVNDVALAVAALSCHKRILVLDLDLHQGDGNAAAFSGRGEVFTASLHQQSAFPHPKLESDLDVGLPDGTGDEAWLEALDQALEEIDRRFEPEVVIYVAGTDPFIGDGIGALTMSEEGLIDRDRRVAFFARARGAGLVVLPAGGYSPQSPSIAARGFAAIAKVHVG